LKFRDVLFNLLGIHSKKRLLIEGKDWKAQVSVKGQYIIEAHFENEEKLEGEEALKFLLTRENEIKTVNLLPLENEEEKMKISQMELFSLLPTDVSVFPEEDTESTELGEIPVKIEEKVKEVCLNYFNRNNIKMVITEESENSEPFKELISNLNGCKVKEAVITYSRDFILLVFKGSSFIAVIVDSEELPNFKLYEPQLVEELRNLLTAEY